MSFNEHLGLTILQARISPELLAKWDWVLTKLSMNRQERMIALLEKDIGDHWSDTLQTAFEQIYGSAKTKVVERNMIYFIQQGEDGPIKIGKTTDINRRLKELQTGTPNKLHLVGLINEDNLSERDFHSAFSHLHITSEWYKPGEDLLSFIEREDRDPPPE